MGMTKHGCVYLSTEHPPLWDLKRGLRSTVEQGCCPCLKRLQSLFHRLDLQKAKHLGITSFVRDLRVFDDERYTPTLPKYLTGASTCRMKGVCIYLRLSIPAAELLQGRTKLAATATPTRTAYGSTPTRPHQIDQRVR